MKKILYFVAAVAVLAMSFTGCKKNGGNEPEVSFFTINVTDITATGAVVEVVPAADTVTYYWTILEGDVSKLVQDSINAQVQDEIDYLIFMYEYYYSQTVTIAQLLSDGTDAYAYHNLYPLTTYSAVAVGLDADGKFTGEAGYKVFKTKDLEATSEETYELEAELNDYRADDGDIYIIAAPADSSIIFYLDIYTEEMDGTFTFEDMDDYYSYVEFEDGSYSDLYSASLTGATTDAGYNLTGNVVALNGVKYNLKLTCIIAPDDPEPAPARKVIAKKAPKAAKRFIRK